MATGVSRLEESSEEGNDSASDIIKCELSVVCSVVWSGQVWVGGVDMKNEECRRGVVGVGGVRGLVIETKAEYPRCGMDDDGSALSFVCAYVNEWTNECEWV